MSSSDDKDKARRTRAVAETEIAPGKRRRVFRPRSGDAEKSEQGKTESAGANGGKSANGKGSGSGRRRRNADGRQRRRNEKQNAKNNAGLRNLVTADPNAPDGAFDADDLSVRSVEARPQRRDSIVPVGEVAWFSSEQGRDFATMTEERIEFLKPHQCNLEDLWEVMPELDLDRLPEGRMLDLVGVKIHGNGEIDWYDCENTHFVREEEVVVETQRGLALGIVKVPTTRRFMTRKTVPRVFRQATRNDRRQRERNREKAARAMELCRRYVSELRLQMKLVEVHYMHGGNKAVFYFVADGRVDFRTLVRKLASDLHIRVEMRQIGVRDAARMVGGIGLCGQPLCCATYMRRFGPVSIRMAKDQDLVLNPEKVSGQCGRLLCCLAYEAEAYREKVKGMPKTGKYVMTPKGEGRVRDRDILRQLVRVQFEGESVMETFPVSEVAPAPRSGGHGKGQSSSGDSRSGSDPSQ